MYGISLSHQFLHQLEVSHQLCLQDILELLSIFRNDPIRIVRSWENRSNPLPKAKPTLKDLQKCEVPWALQANPRRYAAFWGHPPID
eukprot:s1127_g27.t1